MVRFVCLSTLVTALCSIQTGCCCCRLPLLGLGGPKDIFPKKDMLPPNDSGAPTDLAGPKDIAGLKDKPGKDGKDGKDGNVPVGGPIDMAIRAVEQRGGNVKRDEGQPDRPVVEVSYIFKPVTDADVRELKQFSKLRKLQLTQDQNVTGTGLKDLAGLQDLEYLNVSSSPVSDEGAKAIASLRKLKYLNIMGTKVTDTGIRDIATLDRLEELAASGMLLNGPAMDQPRDAALKELGNLKQLRTLDLSNTNAADATAKALAGLSQLKALQIFGTRVTDQGLRDLAGLKQLEELRIGYQVTDAGVNALAGHPQLRVLSLWNNSGVGDGCVKTLAGLNSLRELDLNRTRIGGKGKTEIRKSLPGCKVKL